MDLLLELALNEPDLRLVRVDLPVALAEELVVALEAEELETELLKLRSVAVLEVTEEVELLAELV